MPSFVKEGARADHNEIRRGPPIAPRGDGPGATSARPAKSTNITLAQAIQEALDENPTIRASAESIKQAQADVWTSSLLPNPELTLDTNLQGFHKITPAHSAGPPAYDATVSYPVDWLVFGKRAAAMEVSQRAVDVSAADRAERIRQMVAGTIAAFYDVLEARERLRFTQEDVDRAQRLMPSTELI
jgi:cobalt-zinc-cadmium efflux system outer membrane protein